MIKSPFAKAFTLIELLVVIVIVAILAALLFPVFGIVMENARTTKCSSNLRQIASAMFLFANDHNGYFPESGGVIPWGSTDTPPPGGSGQASWMEQLSVYTGLSISKGAGVTTGDPQNLGGNSIFTCPSSSIVKTADKYYSYFNGVHAAYAANGGMSAIKQQAINYPSEQILSGDVTDWPDTAGLPDADKDDYTQNPFDLQPTFHRGKVNILFADGHVGLLTWSTSLSPAGFFDVTKMATHYAGTSLNSSSITGYLTP